MEMIHHTQVLLAHRSEQLKHGHRELVEEKGALENQLQGTLANTAILEHWLQVNDKGVNFPAGIDDVFEPADPLSKQLLECQASDLAIEYILYAVDNEAQQLVIPVETYLKHVQGLAREQFFNRATSQRISQLQLSQYGSTVQEGRGLRFRVNTLFHVLVINLNRPRIHSILERGANSSSRSNRGIFVHLRSSGVGDSGGGLTEACLSSRPRAVLPSRYFAED